MNLLCTTEYESVYEDKDDVAIYLSKHVTEQQLQKAANFLLKLIDQKQNSELAQPKEVPHAPLNPDFK